jgi:hypothetical protein
LAHNECIAAIRATNTKLTEKEIGDLIDALESEATIEGLSYLDILNRGDEIVQNFKKQKTYALMLEERNRILNLQAENTALAWVDKFMCLR